MLVLHLGPVGRLAWCGEKLDIVRRGTKRVGVVEHGYAQSVEDCTCDGCLAAFVAVKLVRDPGP
jgi:hypothetical protein